MMAPELAIGLAMGVPLVGALLISLAGRWPNLRETITLVTAALLLLAELRASATLPVYTAAGEVLLGAAHAYALGAADAFLVRWAWSDDALRRNGAKRLQMAVTPDREWGAFFAQPSDAPPAPYSRRETSSSSTMSGGSAHTHCTQSA